MAPTSFCAVSSVTGQEPLSHSFLSRSVLRTWSERSMRCMAVIKGSSSKMIRGPERPLNGFLVCFRASRFGNELGFAGFHRLRGRRKVELGEGSEEREELVFFFPHVLRYMLGQEREMRFAPFRIRCLLE